MSGSRAAAPRDRRRRPGGAARVGPHGGGVRDDVDPVRNEPFRVDSHRVMPRFPFEDAALNDIVVHERIIDLAEQLLGITDLRLYQAMLSAKYGEGALERRAAPARRLREPHARRAPSRARLPAARDVRLPERRDGRDGGDQGGVAPAHR